MDRNLEHKKKNMIKEVCKKSKVNVILFFRYESNSFDELWLKTLKNDHYAILFCVGLLKYILWFMKKEVKVTGF